MDLPLLTGAGFDKAVNQDKETCIIVFSKESCNVCARLEPTIVKISKDFETSDELNFYTMDVLDDDAKRIFKSWQLVGVPQTVFIKEGEFVEAFPGALDESILRKEIDRMLHPKEGLGAKLKKLFGK